MTAGDGQTPSITALAADGPAVWFAGQRDPDPRRVVDLAMRPDGSSMVAGADPDVVYVAAPAGHGARGPGRFQPLALPAFTPTAIAAAGTSVLVAVSQPAPAPALLLRWELAAADSAPR
jgi:hypothetical protein